MTSHVYCNGGEKRKKLKIYSEVSVGFYIYFGISDMLVHQHCALLKVLGGWFFIFTDLWSP